MITALIRFSVKDEKTMAKLLYKTLLILFMTNNVWGQDTTYFDYDWNKTNKQNSMYYRIDIKTGEIIERTDYFTSTNQLQMRGQFTSLSPETMIGYFTWYHSNGILQHAGKYSDNKEIGEHIWYHDNGLIDAIEHYRDGLLDGELKEYYENGNLSIKTGFIGGVQNSYTQYYREHGILHSEGMFKNGDRHGVWYFYDMSGKLLNTNEFKTE